MGCVTEVSLEASRSPQNFERPFWYAYTNHSTTTTTTTKNNKTHNINTMSNEITARTTRQQSVIKSQTELHEDTEQQTVLTQNTENETTGPVEGGRGQTGSQDSQQELIESQSPFASLNDLGALKVREPNRMDKVMRCARGQHATSQKKVALEIKGSPQKIEYYQCSTTAGHTYTVPEMDEKYRQSEFDLNQLLQQSVDQQRRSLAGRTPYENKETRCNVLPTSADLSQPSGIVESKTVKVLMEEMVGLHKAVKGVEAKLNERTQGENSKLADTHQVRTAYKGKLQNYDPNYRASVPATGRVGGNRASRALDTARRVSTPREEMPREVEAEGETKREMGAGGERMKEAGADTLART
jgi:hypothetical protein